jgi:hypothetical protein
MTEDDQSLKDKIMQFIAGLGWRVFIRFSGMTEQEYWTAIHDQECTINQVVGAEDEWHH